MDARKARVTTITDPISSLVLNHLIPVLLLGATKCAVLRHEWGAMTAEVKTMNMSGDGIAPEIADHPHVVM